LNHATKKGVLAGADDGKLKTIMLIARSCY